MKILVSEAIQELDDNFIEAMVWDKNDKVKISKFRLKWNVMKRINKKNFFYNQILKAICLILITFALPITIKAAIDYVRLTQSSLIDDSNKDLIGTEVIDDNYIIYSNGTYRNSAGEIINLDELAKSQETMPDNKIIKETRLENFTPSSVVEVMTNNLGNNSYSSPEIILVNGSVCVLTQADGAGWELKKGDILKYSFKKYKSNVIEQQSLLIGYVKDGVMYQGEIYKELDGSYVLKAQDDGEYFIYLLNVSSDYLSLKQGDLITDN